ncbi:DUF2937 family protein [Salinarimonas rosea]|uniref:DUF2937 family protein n=1 Tax=Salinarimonas rosea TaxID=552063 RepID=UPI00042876D9|nr:DUF2937 family protein [Salinarimonas rosea]
MPLSRIAAMGMGLVGALAGSQGPEFAQQYEQRLGGAVDELATVVARFDAGARDAGLDREGALGRLEANPDDLVRRQGTDARAAAARLAALRAHAARLAARDGLSQVLVVLRDGDPQIAAAAYRTYEPAVPVTADGAIAGGLGFASLWLLTFGAGKGVKRGGRKSMALARARLGGGRKTATATPRAMREGPPERSPGTEAHNQALDGKGIGESPYDLRRD